MKKSGKHWTETAKSYTYPKYFYKSGTAIAKSYPNPCVSDCETKGWVGMTQFETKLWNGKFYKKNGNCNIYYWKINILEKKYFTLLYKLFTIKNFWV